MRRVFQDDENGCGVACVAMIAGITYDDARRIIFKHRRGTYTNTTDLRRALKRLHVRIAGRMTPLGTLDYRRLREQAILKVNLYRGGTWHWVVWDPRRKIILDPQRKHAKRYRVHSMIVVQS